MVYTYSLSLTNTRKHSHTHTYNIALSIARFLQFLGVSACAQALCADAL